MQSSLMALCFTDSQKRHLLARDRRGWPHAKCEATVWCPEALPNLSSQGSDGSPCYDTVL